MQLRNRLFDGSEKLCWVEAGRQNGSRHRRASEVRGALEAATRDRRFPSDCAGYVSTSRVRVNVQSMCQRIRTQSTCQRVNVQSACQPVSVQRVCRPVHVQDTSVRVGLSMCRICVGLSTCKIRVSLSTCRKRVSLTALETTACPGQANLYPGR